MKKRFIAFSMAEMLVVLAVIGALSTLIVSVLGQKVNRNKGMFKKAYSLAERIVAETVNDQTYYAYDPNKFGFRENSNVPITGAGYYTSHGGTESGNTVDITLKFCNLFSYNLNLIESMKLKEDVTGIKNDKEGYYCRFTSNDGIDWFIRRAKREDDTITVDKSDYVAPTSSSSSKVVSSGFIIAIDTNGFEKTPNIPADFKDIASNGEETNRDRFFIYVNDDGKMQIFPGDTKAIEYLKATDLNN